MFSVSEKTFPKNISFISYFSCTEALHFHSSRKEIHLPFPAFLFCN